MTIQDIFNKIIARWWLVLVFFLISLSVFFPTFGSHSYRASIGLGANFNHPAFIRSGIHTSSQYAIAMDELSRYLASRFSSTEVQMRVAQEANLAVNNFNPSTPFYDIVRQGGGFISISFTSPTKTGAENFLEAIKNVYTEVITTEMASEHILDDFKIKPQAEFINQIAEVRRPFQFEVLPIIAGLLAGLFVAVILPYKKPLQAKEDIEKQPTKQSKAKKNN